MRRFVVLFLLVTGAGFALVLAPFTQPAILSFTGTMAQASADIIHFAGGQVQLTDYYSLTAPATGFTILVANGCNGINVLVLLWAAQMACPAGTWTGKLKKMVLGGLVVLLANIVRIISLFYLVLFRNSLL